MVTADDTEWCSYCQTEAETTSDTHRLHTWILDINVTWGFQSINQSINNRRIKLPFLFSKWKKNPSVWAPLRDQSSLPSILSLHSDRRKRTMYSGTRIESTSRKRCHRYQSCSVPCNIYPTPTMSVGKPSSMICFDSVYPMQWWNHGDFKKQNKKLKKLNNMRVLSRPDSTRLMKIKSIATHLSNNRIRLQHQIETNACLGTYTYIPSIPINPNQSTNIRVQDDRT